MSAATIEAGLLLVDAWHRSHSITYRHGYADGRRVGVVEGRAEESAAWCAAIGALPLDRRTLAEVEAARRPATEPCGHPSCSVVASCATCIYVEYRNRCGEWKGTD